MSHKDSFFGRFAKKTADLCGSPWTFTSATAIVVIWAISGPFFGFSETWQLVINTSTTIITFLMVFIIQHTQNKDSAALQIKLDELIRAHKRAHNALLDIEELSDKEINKIRNHYRQLAEDAHNALRAGQKDKNKPDVSEALHKILQDT